MKIKNLHKKLEERYPMINERLFVYFTPMICLALILRGIAQMLSGANTRAAWMLIEVFVALAIVAVVTARIKRINIGIHLVSLVMLLWTLPEIFVNGNGVDGAAPLWAVCVIFFVTVVVRGKLRYAYQAAGLILTGYLCARQYSDPGFLMTPYSQGMIFTDTFVSLMLVSVLLSAMTGMAFAAFRKETKISKAQRIQLERLNKSQNQFFSSMSHEIRTPINTIIGLNEMNLREDISDEVAENSQNIRSASKMLLNLINDILDMSKIESGQMEITTVPYDVGNMLSDIVAMLWIRAHDKGLELNIDVDPNVPRRLIGDEVKIKQILINILTNGIKYTREGSVKLTIQASRGEGNKVTMIYTVTDTGIGIKKESIPHLFSAFRRVDEQTNRYIEGTGLGLSIVKQYTELMGGSISVNSVYTQGSTFIIEIPQQMEDGSIIGDIDLTSRNKRAQRSDYHASFEAPEARILAVDDNAANLMVVKKLLRDTKVQIDTASNGVEALQRTSERFYHVILMDHLMPEMDGIECLHRFRDNGDRTNIGTKVVALTANAGSENQALYAREGFDGYLLKPVNSTELESTLIKLLPPDLVHLTEDDNEETNEADRDRNRNYLKRLPILITTESACGIPKKFLKGKNIAVLPYYIMNERGSFQDGVEAETGDLLFDYINKQAEFAQAIPPSAEECERFFGEQLTRATRIIHITASKELPDGGYETILEASKAFENVTIVDSGQTSSGLALMVLAAEEMTRAGFSAEKIVDRLNRMRDTVHGSFLVCDTQYMRNAGMISRTADLIAKALTIRPTMVVRHGRVRVRRLSFGSPAKVRKRYIISECRRVNRLTNLRDDPQFVDSTEPELKKLFVTYVGLESAELEEIQQICKEYTDFKQIHLHKVSSSVALKSGPGSIGMYYFDKRQHIRYQSDLDELQMGEAN